MKFKSIIIFLLIFFFVPSKILASEKNFSVMCSSFPVYDFARQVAGGEAEINLLLKPGTEPHEFEPSALDIKALNDSDIFIFTGKYLEPWAEKFSSSLTKTLTVDASKNIELINNDPHIWLDLHRAQEMVKNIAEGFAKKFPEKEKIFQANAEAYCEKLKELDEKFKSLKKNRVLVFAGEFSCNYFITRYGFEYISAYEGENEPSVKKMAEVLKFINENGVKYIFSDAVISSITRSIAEQTKTEILIFNTAHVIFQDSPGFLELMSENLKAIEKAINN